VKYRCGVVVLLVLMIIACSEGGGGELQRLLPSPDDVPGITRMGRPQLYGGQKLFDYMNGGAELFFEYGFERACVQRYQTPPGEVTAEIYQMDLPANAYGIYTFDTQGEHPPIGQDATYERGLLTFWKDRYFVRVFSENEDLKETLLVLGRDIAQKITQEGERPDILASLPSRGVEGDSLLYFRGQIALNNAYFLSNQDVLALHGGAEGITFPYKPETQPLRVIMVRYPTGSVAEEAFQSLRSSDVIKEGAINNKILLGKSRRGYGGATVVGDLLIVALDGAGPQAVTGALRSLTQRGGQG
jgi:hypothetical protein